MKINNRHYQFVIIFFALILNIFVMKFEGLSPMLVGVLIGMCIGGKK